MTLAQSAREPMITSVLEASDAGHPALVVPEGPTLTYLRLRQLVEEAADLEAGRAMEIDALVGAMVELADRLGAPVPHLRRLYACTKLLDERTRRSL